ncbi:MAG: hypothetical protein AAF357_07255, partial [Verrucomicrobiota bacterium]
MIDLIQHPFGRLTLLLAGAAIALIACRRLEPNWKIAIVRAAFLGGLILLIISASSFRLPVIGWKVPAPAASSTKSDVVYDQVVGTQATAVRSAPAPHTTGPGSRPFPWNSLAALLWILGALLFLARFIAILTRAHKEAAAGHPAPDAATQLWGEACEEAGMPSRDLVVIAEPVSPYLLINGTLVIPHSLIEQREGEHRLIHLFRHEAAHLR